MPILVTCPVCSKKTTRKPSQSSNVCCSNACGQKLRSKNALAKYNESQLRHLYLIEKWPFRRIAAFLGFKDTRQLRKVFAVLNIPIRRGRIAVIEQWRGNTERRTAQAARIRSTSKTHEKTDEYRTLIHQRPVKKWSKDVRARDGFACRNCGKVDKTNHAHHILGVIERPDLLLDVSNGITLCKRCHGLEHGRRKFALEG